MKQEDFETKLKKLEEIVAELEKGDISLENSLKKFEEGMKISKDCSKLLQNAEKKITIILEENGELKEDNFSTEE
jgi:exodeoxyribonuclease VII small subunit